MRRPVVPCIVLALLLASGLAAAQGISVVVDGQALSTSAPPTEIGGRIMVGMRDIFERLGATVRWNDAERQITATRGDRVVELWIGRNYATVDGRRITLDVPPTLLGGFTYVPVRFPSEALGATVSWLAPQRTVLISTASMPPIGGGQAGTVRGCLLGNSGTPRQLVIRRYDGNAAETYTAQPGTVYQRGRVDEALAPAQVNDIEAGDDVTLTLNAARLIDRVEARLKIITINFATAGAAAITDQAGTVYSLSTEVKVIRTGTDGEIRLQDIRRGEEVALRVNPVSNQVWVVRAPRAGTPPAGAAEITEVVVEGYTRPLHAGENLTVRLQGTAGGQATFDIGAAHRGIALREGPAGTYRGQYKVAADEEVLNAVVSGRLKVGGAAAPSASATQRVSLDSVPPTVAGFFPANGAQVSTDRPTIGCTLDDGNGTGTDRDTVALLVRGTDVTRAALVAESGVTYYSPAITMGEVAVTVRASDAAGNRAEASWRFTTTAGKMPLGIASISHTPGANATVGSGDKVTVTLRARSKGRSASFDIEGVCTNVTMTKQTADADSDLWTGTYLVKQGDAAQKAKVIGHFVGEKGVRYDLTDDESITIDASARTRLALTAPVAGSKVPDQFEIAGTALAGRTLTWDVTFAGRQPWVGGSSSGSIASGRVKAGADGKWRVTVDASPVRDQVRVVDSFTVTVTRRSGGQVVEQAEITVAPLRP